MRLKSQKGSITLFVLIALLFYMGFLMLLYAANVNKVQTISEKLNIVKSIYNKNVDNIDEVYIRTIAKTDKTKPTINSLPDTIITNITELATSYEEYGYTGGETIYTAFNLSFSSMDDLLEYVISNNKYGKTEIRIDAYGNNEKDTTSIQTVEIKKGVIVTTKEELESSLTSSEPLYIRLNNNVDLNNTISFDDLDKTIDLNNNQILYKVYNQSFDFITIGSNAKLTVLDSSSQKNGKILASMSLNDGELETSDGNNRNNTVVCIKNNGELNIESGTIGVIARQLLDSTYGTSVTDISTAIYNSGTVNLKGGNITAETITQACVNLLTKNSNATANGIINKGILNLEEGTIDIKSESKIIRGQYATRKGNTYAYSYGVVNTGTLNNSNNVQITVNSTASTDNANVKANEAIEIK